ncbi:VanZ family protein [Microbulbifer sp. OS29]|uniref:VanZ family protein n=1 Tax=Microbulbifer okhotskensis TaxID=2926617 RepID=A0A9X2EPQ4_9GAMM|nr:VanZ family protein [Microbulbifer okhotskensis]MCO1336172.1 VanZ family protein [Microbulbifer okhotskensis]
MIIQLPLRLIHSYWITLTLIFLGIITALSLYPLQTLPSVPGSDKTHHLIAYSALMFPVALRKPNYWWLIGVFFVLWSGGIELLQPYVNRACEWLDFAANSTGVLCGAFCAQIAGRIIRKD